MSYSTTGIAASRRLNPTYQSRPCVRILMCYQIEAQVRRAELALLAALNGADAEGVLRHLHAHCNSFWPGGLVLFDTLNMRECIADTFAAGFRFDLQYEALHVRVYGNSAIVTGYLVGRATLPDRTTDAVKWRMSSVRIRQKGEWKIVHWHASPLFDA